MSVPYSFAPAPWTTALKTTSLSTSSHEAVISSPLFEAFATVVFRCETSPAHNQMAQANLALLLAAPKMLDLMQRVHTSLEGVAKGPLLDEMKALLTEATTKTGNLFTFTKLVAWKLDSTGLNLVEMGHIRLDYDQTIEEVSRNLALGELKRLSKCVEITEEVYSPQGYLQYRPIWRSPEFGGLPDGSMGLKAPATSPPPALVTTVITSLHTQSLTYTRIV